MALVQVRASLGLTTRRQRQIENEMNRDAPLEGARQEIAAWQRQLPNAVHRDEVGPCNTFNCHGLTFASRRTWIHQATEVQKILDDDDYHIVDRAKVKPGDVAIFTKNGEIGHSGIVVEVIELLGGLRVPRILSKWARLHEVVHRPSEGPYHDHQVTYYRISR
jgi:hypothetical protein